MNIERLPLSSITPYKGNAKKHTAEQIQHIMNSIEQFGFNDPIGIAGPDNVIVEGHGRFFAMVKRGEKEIDCIRLDHLTDEERRAYALVHNQSTLETPWDDDLLDVELSEIFDIDMTDFGFEGSDTIITDGEDDDYDAEPPENPKAKLGDIYVLGDHRLVCGDATNKDDILKLIQGGGEIDMTLTDPPYGVNIVDSDNKVGASVMCKNKKFAKIMGDDSTDTAEKCYEILKEVSKEQVLFGGNYFIGFLPYSDGWIVWDKRDGMTSNNFADGEMAWCSFHTPLRIIRQKWKGMTREGDRKTELSSRVHPTQKPVGMLAEILNRFTKKGDSILDPFGGSGSTLIACEQTGRKCYMCELSPAYVDVIIDRYIKYKGSDADVFLLRDGEKIPYAEVT